MADLSIASAAALTGASLAGNDLLPVLDVSASAGSKGSKITVTELFTGRALAGTTALGLLNGGTGAYDLTLAHSGTLTAGRTLSFDVNDAARTVSLAGNLTVPATGTAALLGVANVFTAQQTNATAGASGAPAFLVNGAWLTSTASAVAQVLIQQSGATTFNGSASGTGFAVNCGTGFGGNLLNLQKAGIDQMLVRNDGFVRVTGAIWSDGSEIMVATSGRLGFNLSTGPSLYGPTGLLEVRNNTNANALSLAVYNTYTSSTSFERFMVDWTTAANTCRIGTMKGSGGGTARDLALMSDGTVRMTIKASGVINITGLPTSSSGLATGDIYSNSGVLTVVP
ncbi:hypothetical protein [Prosthecobacter sp.]|uniref:hypothetical protein n=1 Tax=Prosthecobacter sp. TaxID=1965333 RepID=UPI003784F071